MTLERALSLEEEKLRGDHLTSASTSVRERSTGSLSWHYNLQQKSASWRQSIHFGSNLLQSILPTAWQIQREAFGGAPERSCIDTRAEFEEPSTSHRSLAERKSCGILDIRRVHSACTYRQLLGDQSKPDQVL